MRIRLERVHYMPKELKPGVLYVSEEFGTAAHLCACGCGSKVRTPLGPVAWTLEDTEGGPTLRPSIGNWQFDCQSHYWISHGNVVWADQWSSEEIVAGRAAEDERRRAYYAGLDRQRSGILQRLWEWFRGVFRR